MIRVVRALRSDGTEPGSSVTLVPASPFVAWGCARRLVAELETRLAPGALEAALASDRALASLVLPGLGELRPEERAHRDAHRADRLGYMTHNPTRLRPLVAAIGRLLAALLARAGIDQVVLPDFCRLDPESGRALLFVEQQPMFTLVLGASPSASRPVDAIDRLPFDRAARWLETLRDRERVSHEDGGDEPPEEATRDGIELPSPPEPPPLSLAELRDAFGAYAFPAVAHAGVRLLATPDLDDDARAEVHTLVALAAYNQQVATAGERALPGFLDHHLRAALALERSPLHQSHLLYRLTINSGRRQGDLAAAADYAEAAIGRALEAARAADGPAAVAEAWALNGRAYLHARAGRLDAAIDDSERAVARLRGAALPPWLHEEGAAGLLVFCDNLAELYSRKGELEPAMRWQAELERAEARFPQSHVAPFRWVTLLRQAGRFAEARERANEGVVRSREDDDPVNEERYLSELADIAYRLGDAAGALASFKAARALRAHLGDEGSLFAAEGCCALAALRASDLVEAQASLGRALTMPVAAEDVVRAELLAALALVAGRGGDGARADALGNEAIALAVAAGVRDPLLRVSRLLGEACLALGRVDDARTALLQAIEIAYAFASDTSPPAVEIAAVRAALLGLEGPAQVAEGAGAALHALAAGLADAETWWHLAAVLERLPDEALSDPELAAPLAPVVAAARHRPDCARALSRLAPAPGRELV